MISLIFSKRLYGETFDYWKFNIYNDRIYIGDVEFIFEVCECANYYSLTVIENDKYVISEKYSSEKQYKSIIMKVLKRYPALINFNRRKIMFGIFNKDFWSNLERLLEGR